MITQNDIKLLESERMQDTEDGGGRATGTVVVDGGENNVFPDVSEADRVNGRVNFRKLFLSILTQDTDTYFGSNVIVAAVPDDPNISITLFTTGQAADLRSDAQSRVESYVARGPRYQGYLYDNHIAGQQALLILQRQELELPAVGDTLVIVKNPDEQDEEQQFVQITDVSADLRQFTDNSGDYIRNVVTAEISDPLLFDVEGGQPSRFDDTQQSFASRLHETLVADASRYYGTVPLAAAVSIGQLSVNAQTIFGQVVPSAQQESAITDARPHSDLNSPVALTQTDRAFTTLSAVGPGDQLFLSTGCYPGSLSITTSLGTIIDKAGRLLLDSTTDVGSIDYGAGALTFTSATVFSGSKTVTYRPATQPPRNAQSIGRTVTPASRSQIFVFLLDPRPAPGTLQVSYRAQGNWVTLKDDGSGAVVGAATGLGAGAINYVTGDLNVTLGALPDVDTEIILVYSTQAQSIDRSGATGRLEYKAQLPTEGIEPGTVVLTWPDGQSGTLTANENGSGILVGDCIGSVNYRTGEIIWQPNALPPVGSVLTINYQSGTPLTLSVNNPARNPDSTITINLGETNVLPGSIQLDWNIRPQSMDDPGGTGNPFIAQLGEQQYFAVDDGAGGLTNLNGDAIAGAVVDYAAGTVRFLPDQLITVPSPQYNYPAGGTRLVDGVPKTIPKSIFLNIFVTLDDSGYLPTTGATVNAKFRTSDSPSAASEQFTVSTMTYDLTTNFGEKVTQGGVLVEIDGNEFVDRAGRIDTAIDRSNGAGTQAGTVDYTSGLMSLTAWSPGDTNDLAVQGLSTTVGLYPVDSVVFRSPAAPLRPGSLTVQFQMANESGITTATADVNGDLSAPQMTGKVDYDTGIVRLWFGEEVPAAGNEGEPWYDASMVNVAGNIFKPALALADTIRFGAVTFTYLPLDANLLGLNPVRLPSDGRVPIFRPGDMAVIHHTDSVAAATYSNSDVVNFGRSRLERVRALDVNGEVIDPARYTTDLDAGTLTWVDVSGVPQPATIEHMIADAVLVQEAQITGDISVSRPTSHDFPFPGSYISSALQFGDLFARQTNLFEQQTWQGNWLDTLEGNAPIASYDLTNNPITVTNEGAITERWALIFTGTNAFNVVGETVGQIAVGNTASNLAPINPATQAPYFNVPAAGWGAGWSVGNVVRFNTVGAQAPIWALRTIQQGPPGDNSYDFKILIRGDVDA